VVPGGAVGVVGGRVHAAPQVQVLYIYIYMYIYIYLYIYIYIFETRDAKHEIAFSQWGRQASDTRQSCEAG